MHIRKVAIGGVSAAVAIVIAGATAWACVSGPSITLNPANAKPGQTVEATMRDFRKADPILVRWNDLAAPVMATFASDGSGNLIKGTFTVPDNAKSGNYVVIFTQTAPDGKLSQAPVRALITVTAAGGAQPVVGAPIGSTDAGRPAGLVTENNEVSGGALVLVAVGVAGLGMLVAGVAAMMAGRRSSAPQAARVKS